MRHDGDLNAWWRAGIAVVRPFVRAAFRLHVTGAEHVPTGAAVLAANHVSALDGVLLAVATGRDASRMTRFLVAAEFFDRRRFGWALRLYRQIPLHRGAADDEALGQGVATVSRGALAGIFPEGRVNARPEAGLQRGHRGVARIALAARAPVVPVGIWGTQARWPQQGFRLGRPWRADVAVVYGPPIDATGDVASLEDVRRFTQTVMNAIERQASAARALVAARAR